MSTGAAFERLVDIMARLRAPDGCPWDRDQTLDSLRAYLLEETYELLEAMDAGDVDAHRDELGDLLFQVVFQSQIRAEEGAFALADVADTIANKLERRHPHVFGDLRGADRETIRRNWTTIKAAEKAARAEPDAPPSALDGVPAPLPALLRAHRLGAKASAVGFDWPDTAGVEAKLVEELAELQGAIASGDGAAIEEEMGDCLFTLVNWARHLGLEPETALQKANAKFVARFCEVERRVRERGQAVADTAPGVLEEIWTDVKGS